MNRYISTAVIFMEKLNKGQSTDYEVWIKEKDHTEEMRFVKDKLDAIENSFSNCHLTVDSQIAFIRKIIDKKEKFVDKNEKEIHDGDIVRIKDNILSGFTVRIFEIRGKGIYSLENESCGELLGKVDSSDIEIIGKRV